MGERPKIYLADSSLNASAIFLSCFGRVLNCNNFRSYLHVAIKLRKVMPNAEIIICADNKAQDLQISKWTARHVKGKVVAPIFSKRNSEKGLTTFHQLFYAEGSAAVANSLRVEQGRQF